MYVCYVVLKIHTYIHTCMVAGLEYTGSKLICVSINIQLVIVGGCKVDCRLFGRYVFIADLRQTLYIVTI